jgi:hypothetical protein
MPRWRVSVELVLEGATCDAVAARVDRALGAIVAKDADCSRAIGRRPPRYLLGAIRPERAALPRRVWSPRRLP